MHGIGGRVLDLIEHWLRVRRQKVVLSRLASDWAYALSGVPGFSTWPSFVCHIYIYIYIHIIYIYTYYIYIYKLYRPGPT